MMHWNDRVTVAPTSEPITLQEAKDHLRIDHDDDNDYIEDLIQMAREQVESDCARALFTQTRVLTLDRFPNEADHAPRTSRAGFGGVIVIPFAPVQSVSSVVYTASDGTVTTLSTSNYTTDVLSEPARIIPAYGYCWPDTRTKTNAVVVTYIAGWTTQALTPAKVKHLVKLWVSHFYEIREPVNVGNITSAIPMHLSSLTASCQWGSYS
jgi:uncharacterized phiE125 gp8 family phage protein